MALDLNGKWIPVFKAGSSVSNNGTRRVYTTADLDTMVQQFNENSSRHTVPVVVGHPVTNDPAYGWVNGVRRVGDTLEARLEKVPAEFSELVEQGRYRTRSISHYENLLLRHVGFLGASQPAIKGLPNVAYNYDDGGQGFVTTEGVEFSEGGGVPTPETTIIDKLVGAFKSVLHATGFSFNEQNSSTITGDLTPSENLEDSMDMKELAAKLDGLTETVKTLAGSVSTFAEDHKGVVTTIGDMKKQLDAQAASASAAATATRKAGFQEFCEGLVKAGKMTPASVPGAVSLMENAYQTDAATFAEGGENKTPMLDMQKQMMSGAGSVMNFSETATPDKATTLTPNMPSKTNEFAEMKNVDPELLAQDNKILAYAEQHKCSYDEAARFVIGK